VVKHLFHTIGQFAWDFLVYRVVVMSWYFHFDAIFWNSGGAYGVELVCATGLTIIRDVETGCSE